MKIVMVKKILEDGTACEKCREIGQRLEAHDEMRFIDRVVDADLRDPESEGSKLAVQHGVDAAPFFIVDDGEKEIVYTTYLQLRREVFKKIPDQEDIEIENKRKPKASSYDDMY